jgi:Ohr subfamily peroxiredoxin
MRDPSEIVEPRPAGRFAEYRSGDPGVSSGGAAARGAAKIVLERGSPEPEEIQAMANTIYTAKAHVTGGRTEGHGRSDDGALEVDLRIPSEMGGPGGGTNPEELFAVGYAACFEGALGVVARRAKADPGEVAIDSEVSLSPNGKGGFVLGVGLHVTLPGIDDDSLAVELVKAAHAVCPYSNATRGNIEIVLTANGAEVA